MRQISIQLNAQARIDFYPVRPLSAAAYIPLVLVLPGGGYLYTSLREGEPVALRLNTHYLHAAVLHYTTAASRDIQLDDLLAEVQHTLQWLEEHADTYQIDTGRISVLGFSAGGHLAAHCSSRLAGRLYKAVLVYPATRFEGRAEADMEADFQRMFARVEGSETRDSDRVRRTMFSLLALDPTAAVTSRTRPTFVFQTGEDTTVDPLGTLHYCLALRTHQVPFELFYCQKGPHGLALADETGNPVLYRHQAAWFDLAVEWLKDRDSVSREPASV